MSAQFLDRAKSKLSGMSDKDIDAYLKANPNVQEYTSTPVNNVPQATAVPDSPLAQNLLKGGFQANSIDLGGTPEQVNAQQNQAQPKSPLESFLQSGVIPTAGAIAGGVIGGALGGGVGAVPGAGIGGAGAEFIRRGILRIMGDNPDDPQHTGAPDKGIVGDLTASATEGALDSLFQGVGGIAGKALSKGAGLVADTLKLNPENFAQRAMKLTPTEFAKASEKQGIKYDPSKDIYSVLLNDQSQATGKNIFDLSPDQWNQFAADRKNELMANIESSANDYAKSGLSYKLSDVQQQVKNDIMPKLTFQGKGAGQLKDGSQQVLDAVDQQFKTYGKAYGKTLSPNDILALRRSLDSGLDVFKETGSIDTGEVQKVISNRLRGMIANDMPEVNASNKLYSAYADVESTFDKKLRPDASLGYSFGSALQAQPAGVAVGAATGSTHLGALAYLGSFLGTQVTKDPAISGKIASILWKAKDLGSDAPPLIKKFYNVMQPAVVQTLGAGITGKGSQADKSALAATLLPTPDQAGMTTDLPEGQFKTTADLKNPDGSPNVQNIGLTPHDVLVAMLTDPKHSALYKDVYAVIKDQGSNGLNSQQQTAMSKVNAAYAVLNRAEDLYGRLSQKGVIAGNLALAGNALSGNAANPDVAAYETLRQGTLPILARVIGGDVGNLNEQEQMRAKFLPEITDSPEAAKKKFAMLQYLLDTRKSQFLSDPNGGQSSGDSSPNNSSSVTLSNSGL